MLRISKKEMALKVNNEVVEVDHELKKQSGYDIDGLAGLSGKEKQRLQDKFLKHVSEN